TLPSLAREVNEPGTHPGSNPHASPFTPTASTTEAPPTPIQNPSALEDSPTGARVGSDLTRRQKTGQYKQILGERFIDGSRQYLVSRYTDNRSGEIFTPLWISENDCSYDILRGYRKSTPTLADPVPHRYNLRKSRNAQ